MKRKIPGPKFLQVSEIEHREPAIALWADHHFDGIPKWKVSLFALAYHFVANHHKKKKRKSGESYYRHDCRIASRLMVKGFPILIVIAVLLHEAIEDDGKSRKWIAKVFGKLVAEWVDAVSKRPKTKFPDRILRMEDHVRRMVRKVKQGLWQVAIIKCVDRLDNITDTAALNKDDRNRLFEETESHFLPFLRWAAQYIPKMYLNDYRDWILEIEFACDNYWRALALRK